MRKVVCSFKSEAILFSLIIIGFIFTAGPALGVDMSTSNKAPEGYVGKPAGGIGGSSITPPPGYILENEPICEDGWIDIWNGGCNSDPYVFEAINCRDVILGTSGTYNFSTHSFRDTDWFEIDILHQSDIRMEGMADFDVQFLIIDGQQGCTSPSIISWGLANAGEMLTIRATEVPPGKYWLWVGPQSFVGVDCGSQYWFRSYCQAITVPTLSEWGMILLSLLMAATGFTFMWRRQKTA